jgi:hypothetical protein
LFKICPPAFFTPQPPQGEADSQYIGESFLLSQSLRGACDEAILLFLFFAGFVQTFEHFAVNGFGFHIDLSPEL